MIWELYEIVRDLTLAYHKCCVFIINNELHLQLSFMLHATTRENKPVTQEF
jgi:hypothetical protein